MKDEAPSPASLLPLVDIHDRVDRNAGALAERHRERLSCRAGCSGCCGDDLTVFEVEAERIRRRHPELLASGRPHPPGRCAFLSERGTCRVYAERPYVCRTQGLPLRWLWEREEDGEIQEQRGICELNRPGRPLEGLPVEALWTLGPVEEQLAALQHRADGGRGRRVALRALFAHR